MHLKAVTVVLLVFYMQFKLYITQIHDGYEENVRQNRYYLPNHGYQPYWPGGDFAVFGETTTTPKGKVTTKRTTPVRVCGEDCDPAYRNFKEICAKDVTNEKGPSFRINQQVPRSHEYGYMTFDTYCGFLDEQCKTTMRKDIPKYVFVHMGPCITTVLFPAWPEFKLSSRTYSYMKDLCDKAKNRKWNVSAIRCPK